MTDVWGEDRPTRRELAFDGVVALAFTAVMLVIHITLGVAASVAVVLLAAALAMRRVSWQAMSLLGFAGAATQVAGDTIAYLANTAYVVLFLTLGSHREGRVRRFGLVAALVAVAVAAVYGATRGWPELGAPRPSVTSLSGFERLATAVALGSSAAVFCLGGWAWGYLRWQQRQSVQARVDARVEAVERARIADLFEVEQERRRIAADMHDVVAHSWAVVAAQSDGARYALRHNPAGAEQALQVIGETARAAMADLRTIVAQLRDPDLQPSTPGRAQQDVLLERMRASGMEVDLVESGTPDESPLLALTAHRLLAESLTNALKHGDLTRPVRVSLDWTDGYALMVRNGIRMHSDAPKPPGGHGVLGMGERAAVAGGTFAAGPEDGDWVVRAHIPTSGSPRPGGDWPAAPSAREGEA